MFDFVQNIFANDLIIFGSALLILLTQLGLQWVSKGFDKENLGQQ